MVCGCLNAQKPAIDLLPSSHQYMHPESVIDTSMTGDTLTYDLPLPLNQDPGNDTLLKESSKKNRFQFGLSLDSLFQRKENKKVQEKAGTGKIPLLYKKFNPLKLFFFVSALN